MSPSRGNMSIHHLFHAKEIAKASGTSVSLVFAVVDDESGTMSATPAEPEFLPFP
jgi:hypothetical protein